MRYVLGAGISGLLWAYYHEDYRVLTDQVGRAITGADAVVWLNDTPLTRRLMDDLGMEFWFMEKKIGYLSLGQILRYDELADSRLNDLLIKKMVPWEAIDAARRFGWDLAIHTPRRAFTKDSGVIRYLAVDVQEVGRELLEIIDGGGRLVIDRVSEITDRYVYGDGRREGDGGAYDYDHLVSTLPAPVFARLWKGEGWVPPRFHYCPVTFVVSRFAPEWWGGDEYAMVYVADLDDPVSRVGRFGDTWRYEITGRLSDEALEAYRPVGEGVFVNPFGRIVQDVKLESPPGVTFLGRAAEWDYRGLIDRTLERVHGQR